MNETLPDIRPSGVYGNGGWSGQGGHLQACTRDGNLGAVTHSTLERRTWEGHAGLARGFVPLLQ